MGTSLVEISRHLNSSFPGTCHRRAIIADFMLVWLPAPTYSTKWVLLDAHLPLARLSRLEAHPWSAAMLCEQCRKHARSKGVTSNFVCLCRALLRLAGALLLREASTHWQRCLLAAQTTPSRRCLQATRPSLLASASARWCAMVSSPCRFRPMLTSFILLQSLYCLTARSVQHHSSAYGMP